MPSQALVERVKLCRLLGNWMPSSRWLNASPNVKLCRLLGCWMLWLSFRPEYHVSDIISFRAATSKMTELSHRLGDRGATRAKLPHHVRDLVVLDLTQQQLSLLALSMVTGALRPASLMRQFGPLDMSLLLIQSLLGFQLTGLWHAPWGGIPSTLKPKPHWSLSLQAFSSQLLK